MNLPAVTSYIDTFYHISQKCAVLFFCGELTYQVLAINHLVFIVTPVFLKTRSIDSNLSIPCMLKSGDVSFYCIAMQ